MKTFKLFVVLKYVGSSGREKKTRVVSMATSRMPHYSLVGRSRLGLQGLGSALSFPLSYLEKKILEP